MHSSHILTGIIFPLLTLARPYLSNKRLPHSLSPRQANTTCDLNSVDQPENTMQAPDEGLSLVLIALGRGTQNYTCANETAAPAAIGALAQLFNGSCAVANNELGSIAEDAAAIGMHFFVDNTTPDFDIIGLGNTELKRVETAAAPAATDVPWLRLEAQEAGTTSPVKEIYRLNTQGGVAPSSCTGQTAGGVVTVDYEAQYWVYANTEEMEAQRRKRSLGLSLA